MRSGKTPGVVLIAIYHGLWGTAMLPVGCLASMTSGVPDVPPYGAALGFLIMLQGCAMLAGTFGLLTMRTWARQFNIGVELACILFSLMTLMDIALTSTVSDTDRMTALIEMILAAVICRYLTREPTKQLFANRGSESLAGG